MSEITSAIIDAFANNPSFCALADSIRASFRNAAANETVLFTTDAERPAEISPTVAPSFWACFTEEFMNTVQREPRSTGAGA